MFMNKYDDKDNYFKDNYFKDKTEKIKTKEQMILKYLGKKSTNSIAKKITKAIDSSNPKFIYRAPLMQVIGAKIYSLFFQ